MPRDGQVVRRRLERAALELFAERGFDATTAQEIGARAGVTERTFYRHFPDKREVLFASEAELREVTVAALRDVPPGLEPLPALRAALHGVVPLIVASRPLAQLRGPIIAASAALTEREHAKAAALTDLVAATLQEQGMSAPAALLVARIGMDVFATAVRRWGADPSGDLHAEVDKTFAELGGLTAAL